METGSHIECQYTLTTFGIPRDALPVSTSGEMFIDEHLRWIEGRRAIEASREELTLADSVPVHSVLSDIGVGVGTSGDLASSLSPTLSPPLTSSTATEAAPAVPQISWSATGSGTIQHIAAPVSAGSLDIRPNDVLFGRGKTVVEHPGNMKFRNIVGRHMEEYEAASRLEKTCMTEHIVELVKSSDGRFLKRDDGGDWEEVDDETARKKVAHAFRNRRKFYGA